MKWISFFIIFFPFWVWSQADETKNRQFYSKPAPASIYLEAFENNVLKDLEVFMVNKLMLKISSRQQKFGIIVSSKNIMNHFSNDSSLNMELFKMQIFFNKTSGNTYQWSGRFVKINDNQNAVEEKIFFNDSNQIIWNAEVLMEKLFTKFDKWFEQENSESIKELVPTEFTPVEKEKTPPEVKHDSGIDQFRQKIIGLKLGVEDQIKKINEKTTEKSSSGDTSSKFNENKQAQSMPETNPLDKMSEGKTDPAASKEAHYFSRFGLFGGYENQYNRSKDLIDTTTNLTLLVLGFDYERALDTKHQRGILFNLKYKKNTSKTKSAIKPQTEFYFNFYQTLFRICNLGIGFHQRKLAFNNVPEAGQGYQTGEITANFLDINAKFFVKAMEFEIHYGNVMSSSSSYQNLSGVKLSGSQLSLIATYDKLIFNIDFALGIRMINLSGSGANNPSNKFDLGSQGSDLTASYDF